MSNNNDDDDHGAPHTDRSAKGPYTDLPKFRGFIGWVFNKGGGGTFSSVDIDIFYKDFARITRAGAERPIIIAVST